MSTFTTKAPWVITLLMRDIKGWGLDDASACTGSLGHESGGFDIMQERHPRAGRGGWGWAQWTGPRRKAFEQWCRANRYDPSSDQANYLFLVHELLTSERRAVSATQQAKTLYNKTKAFEKSFERAGVKAYASRYNWATKALTAYTKAKKPVPLPSWARGGAVSKPMPQSGEHLLEVLFSWILSLFRR